MPASIRPLTPEDRAAIKELLFTLDPDDWLLRELDIWLAAPGPDGIRGYGGYAMELPEGRLAGLCLLDYSRPGEGHLCGVRVATDLHNGGYGTQLIREVLLRSARHGGRRMWLISHITNLPMHRVAEKLGFARIGEWQVWEEPDLAEPLPGGPPVRMATPDDHPGIAEWLRRHPLAGAEAVTAADYSVWDVAPVKAEDFTAWLAKGELVVADCGEVQGLMACHWGRQDPPQLRIRYLKGTEPAVGSLLAWAREHCQSQPRGVIGMGLPGPQADLVRPWVTRAQEEFHAYVFMRRLDDLR